MAESVERQGEEGGMPTKIRVPMKVLRLDYVMRAEYDTQLEELLESKSGIV